VGVVHTVPHYRSSKLRSWIGGKVGTDKKLGRDKMAGNDFEMTNRRKGEDRKGKERDKNRRGKELPRILEHGRALCFLRVYRFRCCFCSVFCDCSDHGRRSLGGQTDLSPTF